MDKYIKQGVSVINTNQAGYISAKRRKKAKKKLEQLYVDFENLKQRVIELENKNK